MAEHLKTGYSIKLYDNTLYEYETTPIEEIISPNGA